MADPSKPPLRVGFVLLDKFTLAAFAGLIDALRLAADDGGQSRQIHATWRIMTPGAGVRMASCGVQISGSADLQPQTEFDYIAVCGGNDYLDEKPSPLLSEYLVRAHASGVRLLGICTGTFAIARAGLADGRTVCVHWNVRNAFEAQFPGVRTSVDRLFVDEGDLITCAGSTAAIDLGLYLISRHCGRDRAQQAVRHMMLAGIRAPSLPQAHFRHDMEKVADPRVRKAMHFMEQQLDHPPTLPALARYVGVSPRQLERTFTAETGMSPMRLHRIMRLNYGRWMIDNRVSTITQIALDCGFSDAAHFSREFRSHFGVAPSRYRQVQNTAASEA
ncbi:GlxA family transcriptional regulator [Terrihabitans rhizophilus]|uniref:GlxA family transcriptional regulator n=1 Tax=Terrihabitans rhizophilus TaxID=3092662 RepID=A0ABU4RN55_9HYPH|nr:GlxA family transcriptional regulator [Terrihabitans sp. PJ23]MDX6806252.1 GlxA family transcriptional regulator [Terrihabitans sp. PJ23]